jgi:hypothetical protein
MFVRNLFHFMFQTFIEAITQEMDTEVLNVMLVSFVKVRSAAETQRNAKKRKETQRNAKKRKETQRNAKKRKETQRNAKNEKDKIKIVTIELMYVSFAVPRYSRKCIYYRAVNYRSTDGR